MPISAVTPSPIDSGSTSARYARITPLDSSLPTRSCTAGAERPT